MGMFLNSRVPYDMYKAVAEDAYFVDKSLLLQELIPALGREQRFFCITRPRRFGKSVMANMIAAFFGKAADSGALFQQLRIAGAGGGDPVQDYRKDLNRHHVIYIDFSQVPELCMDYNVYISRILTGLKNDMRDAYPENVTDLHLSVWDILTNIYEATGDRFIFVMDEWDAVFHMPFITEADRRSYLLFLKMLLKGKIYVELAYMTGVLPIAKYSDGSELNMFLEYNMATAERFSEYFGFSDQEVDDLFEIYLGGTKEPGITREDLRAWYDGYYTASGSRLYNPRSIVSALTDNQLRNYWTSSGIYDSVFGYVKDNVAAVQDDLALMFAGERIPADIQEYAASGMRLETKDEIYSAMVVYGLLTYADGCVFIPNKELMDSYASMMKKEKSLGYIYQLASVSKRMPSFWN